jgi:hypothetical protein
VDRQLARFVDTLRAWMRGNFDWALESGRYRDDARATAEVEFAPGRAD